MKQLFRRSTPSRQVGILLASDRIMLASLGPQPVFATRAINGPQEWSPAMSELFSRHGLAKSKVRVALAASLYQQVQIDKPAVPEAEMAGALPWAVKDYVNEPVLQLAMDYVDLPTPPAGRPRISVICVPKARVQQLADAVNGIASLDAIVSDELAMTALYEADNTVRMLLWQPRGQDLQLLVFHQGGLCFSRQLRGFTALTGEHEPDSMLLDSLALEIQRSLDYLVGQLKLPELGQMQLAIASSFIGTLVRHMEQTFGFAVSAMANKAILSGVEYLSAYAAALGEDI
ncbi:MSHA biogenesis protein MshI [Aeromonas bestiarum]|uniref:MSHA biogenesis protein MshI n=1 Tax=Aeromonas bestiarum TaxID=105751 RepID=UPI00259F9263|nr:MSHA biogenesis protein MshI [Aeromonas bestiarum]MDM5090797.1 MSHA biogenesis protein MshI [Aeromonas bestiarum]HEH9404928.1 MSHA biogenesis protein MshI [Aeromonas bestiarum]